MVPRLCCRIVGVFLWGAGGRVGWGWRGGEGERGGRWLERKGGQRGARRRLGDMWVRRGGRGGLLDDPLGLRRGKIEGSEMFGILDLLIYW